MPDYTTSISRAVIDYIVNFFVKHSATINFYYFCRPENTIINLDIINEILYHVKTKIVTQVDSLTDLKISTRKRYNNILFVDSYSSFDEIFKRMDISHFEYQGFYLIIVTTHVDDIYTVMLKIFTALWSKHIINANIMFMPPENVNEAIIYSFYPYTSFYCEKIIPVQLNQFKENSWMKKFDYFPEKLQNFHGCSLRIATFPNPPFMMITQDANGAVHVSGIDGILLRVLAQHFNFNAQLFLPPELWGDVDENGTATGAIKMIMDEDVNMTLGFFASLPNRDAVMKPSAVYFKTNLVWIVPPGKPQTALEKLKNPLGNIIWIFTSIFLLFGFAVIGIIKRQSKIIQNFVFGRSIQSPAMNFVNIVFGGSLHRLPTRNFSRFLIVLFTLFCFILRTSYTGGLVKFMQKDTRGQRMQYTAELVKNNFKFYMLHSARAYVLEMPQVLKRTILVTPAEYTEGLSKVNPYSKSAYLTSFGHLAYRNMLVYPKKFYHYSLEGIYTLNIVIYFHKESCLAKPLDKAITNLVNGGLITQWGTKWLNRKYLIEPVDNDNKILNIEQLLGAFQLLIGGLLMGMIAFFFEIVFQKKFLKKIESKFRVF